ncbi:zf-HC2 domain-containing protein [Microbispora hainanensis]|jgi:anti-sigma factor RsiW|uniref:Zf-HC2 domain-containing protein n=1 Tax=Microbispora hainanensis TaxID=568844 RepID=A0A544YH72_9ACTN|nr:MULTISPECIES: zf-HC2 domain-containing protein [Microbispora]NJP25749.1 zf-HC2 domain-containing protein [Microbispora sp. CL1-1]TQS13239.1 zf-HC2 domain-containing protein [Microbispora sp. SCL1-1]TQS16101.1 zf-HC2 domain-containing protein [Microbispora hainanensis]
MSASSPHFDVAAYALGVLDDDDAEAFERHLDECAPCRAELLEAQELPGMLDAFKDGSVSSSERSHP